MRSVRSSLNSFADTIDLNQGSFPGNTSMDSLSSWDNMQNPVENRMSNHVPASSGGNINSISTTNSHPHSFSGWHRGESSSGANNLLDETSYDDSKMRLGWPSSFSSGPRAVATTENWSFEPSDFNDSTYVGNQVTTRSSTMQNYSSNRNSGQSEAGQIPNFYVSSTIGASSASSSTLFEMSDASRPSIGPWASSCERKTLEGTSGQVFPGGSSSSILLVENIKQNPMPACYPTSGNSSVTSEPLNLSVTNRFDRNGVAMTRITPPVFPYLSVPRIAESSGRNPAVKSNAGNQESVHFDAPRVTPARHSSGYAVLQLPRPFSSSESLELRSPVAINPSNALNQSRLMHLSEERGLPSCPWNGPFTSRGGSSSSSMLLSGERGYSVHEEVNTRSSYRNNSEVSMFVSVPETRNVPQGQIDWSFAPGNSASSRNHSSASQIGSSSGVRSSPVVWLPHQRQRLQAHQTLLEFAPWNTFSNIESDSGVQRSHFAPFQSDPFSEDEATVNSLAQHRSDHRSGAFLMDMPRDDTHGWRASGAVEGRHRLIRQVLNAMRRGIHLHPEDYMSIDPFMSEFTELHDRHRDLRLDVDNMSYEELLALEERIGNVSTGLSNEKILACMKQRRYEAMEVSPNLEPCSICQEDYIYDDGIGILDCGHEFHINCINQWLTQKNLCPICKTTALQI